MKTKLLLLIVVINIINCQNVFAQGSRLIGTAGYGYGTSSYTLFDSAAYFYTGSHGGDWNKIMKFTTDTFWNYSGSTFTPASVANQTFDAADNIATTTNLVYSSGSFVKSSLYTNTYDASHNNTSTLVQNWDPGSSTWKDSLRYDHTYDSHNAVITTTDYSWSTTSAAFVPWYHDTALIVGPPLGVGISYLWSSSTTTGYWINSGLDTAYYDGSGYLTTFVTYFWNTSSAWQKNNLFKYINNTAGKATNDTEYRWITAPPSWQNLWAYTYTYDGSGNELTNDYIDWTSGAWVNSSRFIYTYNSYNQATSMKELVWDATSSMYKPLTGSGITYYYYQTYTNTGVPSLNNNTVDLNVFPSPANKMLNLQIRWNELQPFDVMIYNMNGQIMSNYQENATASYRRQIPVDYWAAGNYVVVVKTNSGSTTRQFIVHH